MKRSLLLIAMAVFTATAAYSADLGTLISEAGLQALKPGTQSIDFRLDNLDGKTVQLSSYKGDVVLLNFWATWCPPCRSEMGSLETLYSKFKDKGFVVLAVNMQEGSANVKGFAQQFGLTFPILLDRSGRIGLTYGARALPTTYLINQKGEVTSGVLGAHDWATPQMYGLVRAMLNQENKN